MRSLAKKRAMLAVMVSIVAVMGVTGCGGQSKPPAWGDPSAAKTTGASTPAVCSRIRAAITGDMKPIGSSLGTLVGYAAAADDVGRASAQQQVQQQIKGMGTDITKAAADAADTKLKKAVTTAVSNINALADDPSLLADVSDVSHIPAISKKLDDATHPIAVACG